MGCHCLLWSQRLEGDKTTVRGYVNRPGPYMMENYSKTLQVGMERIQRFKKENLEAMEKKES